MRHGVLWTAPILLGSLVVLPDFAQEPTKAEITKKAKAATVLVEVNGTLKQGSAFCIHESGFFLTNQHVVGTAGEVTLILHPGLKEKQIVAARVVRTDKDLDLALLRAEQEAPFTALPLGSSDEVGELAEIITVGFPYGSALSLEKGKYPAVSVNLGRVSALRAKNGELERIQMDVAVNPGNSGGPVLDLKGKVIGVVVSGVRGATVSFAIPVSHVKRFVSAPEVQVMPPTVAYPDRNQRSEFLVRAVTLVPNTSTYDVELRLDWKGAHRNYKMNFENGVYRTVVEHLQPVPALRIKLSFEGGRLEGFVEDRTFKMGELQLKLSDVRRLRFSPRPSAILADDKSVQGLTSGLDDLEVALGTVILRVNAGKAEELTVEPPARETKVEYTITVWRDNVELARVRDFLGFKNVPSGVDWGVEARKLEGLWILQQAEENGAHWPMAPEEAIQIEGKRLRWVKLNGKVVPGSPQALLTIDPNKKPMTMDFALGNTTWRAIYKIEGNRLIIATNCDDERRPTEFTTRLWAGAERATFLRTYKLQANSDAN